MGCAASAVSPDASREQGTISGIERSLPQRSSVTSRGTSDFALLRFCRQSLHSGDIPDEALHNLVFAAAAVIDRSSFGSLGRSARLTKEYRWPIVGLFIVMFIIVFILQLVVGGAIAAVLFASVDTLATIENGISTGSIIIFGLIVSLIYGLAYGLSGIAVALVYARLREIKEGVAVDQIASVFE